MNTATRRGMLGAAMLAGCASCAAATSAAHAPDAPRWEVLVPSGIFGRFSLRIERAEFEGSMEQVASRLSGAWAADPWPVLGQADAPGSVLSRLTPEGMESISLELAPTGRVEARRSLLRWRRATGVARPDAGECPRMPEPGFVTTLGMLGEPLASLASRDGGTGNLTRAWLAPGDIGAVSGDIERAARRHGLAVLLRFDAPADAPRRLHGGRVLAFGGQGAAAVVTLNRHGAGTAVVVHFQERLP